ncbi:hypothetical protein F2Q68_00038902 [Brassica cretica]|uniref:Uncharacterized protein n=2 Tax=Brassica cretica TaxID=69181 RepID=A0A8S9MGG2_BRACR|nr:hypothetical protein F2Q68_00038902 [Brassica cretica]KAF3497631.1 hypothetical protein DY000_02052468 [Brassica cretica]
MCRLGKHSCRKLQVSAAISRGIDDGERSHVMMIHGNRASTEGTSFPIRLRLRRRDWGLWIVEMFGDNA